MVQCLRRANVPIQSVKKYIALLVQGGKTMEQRYGMVQDYIRNIQEQMDQLHNALALTREKSAFYEKLLKEPSSRDLTYLEEWELFKNEEGKEE
jgi:DNA-binding transcriptional MerR regulator